VKKSRPEDLLNVDIFFDEMPVYGERQLAHDLFASAYALGHEAIGFAKMLGETLPDPPSPFSWLGRLKAPDNRLDIKMHALFPVAAAARALAIRHNVAQRSTRDRIEGLVRLGIGGETDLAALASAHARALSIVLESQAGDIGAGRKPSNAVDLSGLSRRRYEELREILKTVAVVPTLVRDLMFATPARTAAASLKA
jgi:DNA polymerase-3 subunit epsilon/CBS domain-containing protein